MNFLPSLVLLNKWYMGDDVLLEPIADALTESGFPHVFVASNFSELFQGHPSVIGTGLDLVGVPSDSSIIDMADAIKPLRHLEGGRQVIFPDKLRRMYEAAGISPGAIRTPRLYLTAEEVDAAIRLRLCFPGRCIGIVPETRHALKRWPYMRHLIRRLVNSGDNVFIISDRLHSRLKATRGVYPIIGLPLRQLMVWLSLMDVVIGNDTGPMHVAGALGGRLVVITRPIWCDLYEPYENCEIVCSKSNRGRSLYTVSVKRVLGAVRRAIAEIPDAEQEKPVDLTRVRFSASRDSIAIFRLDGLGGTMTMADQAKKIHEATGRKCVIIGRGYEDLFAENPHVSDVVNVGAANWYECLHTMRGLYDTLAEIRFGIGKWHQQDEVIFDQDFAPVQEMFDQFPDGFNKLEVHGMHHVQLTDKFLLLPSDTIDMEVYRYEDPPPDMPSEYVVINNGIDVWHKGSRQTKMWDGWNDLVDLLTVPFVQVGTLYDNLVEKAIDLRGKTSLGQLCSVLKGASAVVTCEGGFMHLGYAVDAPNVLVLRGPTRGKLFEYPSHRFVDSYICDICWSSTPDWYMNCPKHLDASCMQSITPGRVAYNLEEILNEDLVETSRL